MKKIAVMVTLAFTQISQAEAQNGMGVGTSTPEEMLDVNGAIKIGGSIVGAPDAGSIRWNGTNFQGYDGAQWINFGAATVGGNTLDESYNEGGPGAGRIIDASSGALRINGNDGFVVTGTYGSGDEIEATGYGSRMFFNPKRAAFRAGLPSGIQWDPLNIGNYSMGLGHNTIAKGDYSFSSGSATTALGDYSTVMGQGTFAQSAYEMAVGRYNTLGSGSTTAWNASDRIFSIGIGTHNNSREDALVVLKNGNTGIGTSAPSATLDVEGSIQIVDGNEAIGKVLTSDANGNATWQAVPAGADDLGNHTATTNIQLGSNWLSNDGGSEGIRVDNAGNVGIGTATPTDKLDVNGGIRSYNVGIGKADNFNGVQNFVNLGSDNHGGVALGSNFYSSGGSLRIANTHGTLSGSGIFIPGNLQPGQGSIFFYSTPPAPVTAGAGFGGADMVLSAAGNLGIGTTNPTAKLHVGGTAGVDGVRFPDGTLQTTAATSGPADNLGNHSATISLDMNSNRILEVATPLVATDAANKAYVDAHTDADADATNEIQALSISGSDISLSNGGGTVTLPSTTTNTLDGAYDQGGAGVGRTITADAGAVSVQGTDGFEVTGTFGSGAAIGSPGAGTRMFFNPSKSAFRAGRVTFSGWDDTRVGAYSFAGGYNPEASGDHSVAFSGGSAEGDYSFAMGFLSRAVGDHSVAFTRGSAEGDYSIAMGHHSRAIGDGSVSLGMQNIVVGDYSFANGLSNDVNGDYSCVFGYQNFVQGLSSIAAIFGFENTTLEHGGFVFGTYNTTDNSGAVFGTGNTATGYHALATGYFNTATGWYSSTLGEGLIARSNGEFVVGMYNTDYTPTQEESWYDTDRVFVVGVGYDDFNRSDAMVILKNGYTGIGTNAPSATLDIEGTVQIVDGNQGAGKVLTSDASGNATWQTASGGSGVNVENFMGQATNLNPTLLPTFAAFSTTQNTDVSVFEPLSTGNFGIQVKKAGVISWNFNMESSFSAAGTASVVVRVDGNAVGNGYVNPQSAQLDFFSSSGSYYVTANQVVTFEMDGSNLTSGGNSASVSVVWMGTP